MLQTASFTPSPGLPPAGQFFATRTGASCTSHLTDEQAAKVCFDHLRQNEFAQALAIRYLADEGPLSAEQRAWLHILACRHQAGQAKLSRLDGILRIFEAAIASGISHPEAHFVLPSGLKLRLRPGRDGKGVHVTVDEHFGDYLGTVTPDGRWRPSGDTPEAVAEFLVRLAEDPEGVAAESGRRSGRCSWCHRTLTAEESLTIGMGPDCRKRFIGRK